MRKACSKCGAEYDVSEFQPRSDRPGQTHPWCKGCMAEYKHGRYLENRTTRIAETKEWKKQRRDMVRG